MAKHKKPSGQINNKAVFKKLDNLMKDLSRNVSIRVGIIGEKATQKHQDTDLTNAELGAIHEFGATITPTAKMRGFFYHKWGIQKSNDDVVIPARSFLRMPLLSREGKKALNKAVNDNMSTDREFNKILGGQDKTFLTDIANILGVTALNRVMAAFVTGGFGKWQAITDFTKQNRKGDKSNPPLSDTGDLRGSITFEVKEHN